MQLAVNQSQLESAARNGLVDSFNSASLGVNHLLDPFAKPELSATKIVANNDRWQAGDDVNNAQEKLADDEAPSSLMADHTDFFDDIEDGGERITAASSFSEQLRQSAALRLASGSENIITHHKKA